MSNPYPRINLSACSHGQPLLRRDGRIVTLDNTLRTGGTLYSFWTRDEDGHRDSYRNDGGYTAACDPKDIVKVIDVSQMTSVSDTEVRFGETVWRDARGALRIKGGGFTIGHATTHKSASLPDVVFGMSVPGTEPIPVTDAHPEWVRKLIEAEKNGETIQFLTCSEWTDYESKQLHFDAPCADYRIKPKEKKLDLSHLYIGATAKTRDGRTVTLVNKQVDEFYPLIWSHTLTTITGHNWTSLSLHPSDIVEILTTGSPPAPTPFGVTGEVWKDEEGGLIEITEPGKGIVRVARTAVGKGDREPTPLDIGRTCDISFNGSYRGITGPFSWFCGKLIAKVSP